MLLFLIVRNFVSRTALVNDWLVHINLIFQAAHTVSLDPINCMKYHLLFEIMTTSWYQARLHGVMVVTIITTACGPDILS